MFKSVFTKYITAFMLIILISFMILASIISTMVTNFSAETRREIIQHTAHTAKMYLEMEYVTSPYSDLEQLVKYKRERISEYITMLANYTTDLVIMATDPRGEILVTDNRVGESDINVTSVPSGTIASLFDNSMIQRSDDFDGVFNSKYLTYGVPIYTIDGERLGAVFACSSSAALDELVGSMLKTIIMATLWVLLAALVAVYFISERIISPLKEMGRAARSFAKGQFDVRVPVTGHDEVSELAEAFNNMAGSLASLEDMRRTFLANVSHDLRTPMTTIAGFIDNIISGVIPAEKQDDYLKIIAEEVRRLSRLVNSLLDISRIQAGDRKFNSVPFDICEMARQILISFEQKIDDKKLDVEFGCDDEKLYALADRDAIYQILYNICDNGVKFSRDEGKYRINLTVKDKKIHVSVFNEGNGIPEEDIPYVFDRFYKSDRSRGLDKTGVGLGLYISRAIIDAHDEEIWVKSVYGENCEFTFTLPRVSESVAKAHEDKLSKRATE